MNQTTVIHRARLLREIKPLLSDFEENWSTYRKAGTTELEIRKRIRSVPPQWADWKPEAVDQALSDLFVELLIVDIELRRERGEQPDAESYLKAFPDRVADIEGKDVQDALTGKPAVSGPEDLLPRRYRFKGVIGEGAFSEVWLARDASPSTPRDVALKIPKSITGNSVHDLHEEFVKTEHAQSAGVITIIEQATLADGRPFLVMPYLPGSLADRLKPGARAVPVDEAVDILSRVAAAVAHIHSRGLLHLDLKPSNILIGADKLPIVADFGLSESQLKLRYSDNGRGTPLYMAPEMFDQSLRYLDVVKDVTTGTRADIWSLTAILFELLAGRPPFDAESKEAVAIKILRDEPDYRLIGSDPDRRRLADICRQGLAKNPAERFASADDLSSELSDWLHRPSRRRPSSTIKSTTNFILDFDGSELPDVLERSRAGSGTGTNADCYGRETLIGDLAHRIRQNSIVPVTGPTHSGRKFVVGNALCRLAGTAGASRTAVLALPLEESTSDHFLQTVLYELRIDRDDDSFREVAGRDAEIEYAGTRLQEALDGLKSYSLIVVLDEADQSLSSPESKKEIEKFFRHRIFKQGSGVMIVNRLAPGVLTGKRVNPRFAGRIVCDPVEVVGVSATAAARIVTEETGNADIAEEVIRHLGAGFTFYPSAIAEYTRFAVDRFRRDNRALDPVELAYLIAEHNWNDWVEDLPTTEQEQYNLLQTANGTATKLASLTLLAALRGCWLTPEALERADLPIVNPPDWACDRDTEELESAFQISRVGQEVLIRRLSDFGDEIADLAPAFRRLLQIVAGDISADGLIADFRRVLEANRRYLARELPAGNELVECFDPWLQETGVNSIVRPETTISPDPITAAPVLGDNRLTTALSLAVRDHDTPRFAELLLVSPTIPEDLTGLTGVTVRAYDQLLHQGLRIFDEADSIAKWRDSCCDALANEARRRGRADYYFRNWVISWLENTAKSALRADDRDLCRRRLEDAMRLIGPTRSGEHQFVAWLRLRILQTNAKLERNPAARMLIQERALNSAISGLNSSTQPEWWIPRVLNLAETYHRENLDWATRSKSLFAVAESVRRKLAFVTTGRVELTVELARFAFGVALRAHHHQQRITALEFAWELLKTDEEFDAKASPPGHVALRIKVLTKLWKTLYLLRDSGEKKPSRRIRSLRRIADDLLDQCFRHDNMNIQIWKLVLQKKRRLNTRKARWTADEEIRDSSLVELAKKAEEWAKNSQRVGRTMGRFHLELLQLKYSRLGSIRTAAEQAYNRRHDPQAWSRLRESAQRQIMRRHRDIRIKELNAIRTKHGSFPRLFVELAWQKSSYARQAALSFKAQGKRRRSSIDHDEVESESRNLENDVRAVFEEGRAACRNHHLLLLEESRFYRYVHRFDRSIEVLQKLLKHRSPDVRRNAAIMMAETGLAALVYHDDPYYEEPSHEKSDSRRDWLKEQLKVARRRLREDGYNRSSLSRYLVLLDRIDLDLGGSIDFGPIDDLFDLRLGELRGLLERTDVDAAEQTLLVGDAADELEPREALANDWAKAPYRHDYLMAVGQLYLRRAQLGLSPDVVLDCYRSATAFDATYMIERDFAEAQLLRQKAYHYGQVRPRIICQFMLALAIYRAATAGSKVNPNPFPERPRDLMRSRRQEPNSWLELSSRLFQSVEGRTVGQFSDLAARYAAVAQKRLAGR